MLAVQLQSLAAEVLVDLEAIGSLDARAAAQLRIFRGTAHVAECDGLDRLVARHSAWTAAAVRGGRHSEPHLQMFTTDDAHIRDAEIAVEYRLRKALPPRPPAPQCTSGIERNVAGPERAVR